MHWCSACMYIIYIFIAKWKLQYKYEGRQGVEVSVCVSVCVGHKDCFSQQYFIMYKPMNCSLLGWSVCLSSHLSSLSYCRASYRTLFQRIYNTFLLGIRKYEHRKQNKRICMPLSDSPPFLPCFLPFDLCATTL